MQKDRFYSPKTIRILLEGYMHLLERDLPPEIQERLELSGRVSYRPVNMVSFVIAIKADLDRAITHLKSLNGYIVVMGHVLGWDNEEIGHVVGLSPGAVNDRKRRSILKMAEFLGWRTE